MAEENGRIPDIQKELASLQAGQASIIEKIESFGRRLDEHARTDEKRLDAHAKALDAQRDSITELQTKHDADHKTTTNKLAVYLLIATLVGPLIAILASGYFNG